MPHNFKKFPELTNSQMEVYYFLSPHKQITEDFRAKVKKVTDGDTIRVTCGFRDFDFPIRMNDIDAPELNERGGKEAKSWLKDKIEGEEVEILIDRGNRVDKWGRLLGDVRHKGLSMEDSLLRLGLAVKFENRNEGELPKISQELNLKSWFK